MSVASAGDVNADGYGDLLVGAYNNGDYIPSGGAGYLVLGGASPEDGSLGAEIQYTPEASLDRLGTSVSAAGDVDGDGFDDILLGAALNDDGGADAGAVYLVLGSPSPASLNVGAAAAEYRGATTADYLGGVVAAGGDVDGDGFDDMLLGVSHCGTTGAAWLMPGGPFPGSQSVTAAAARYGGETTGDGAGSAVAGAGDGDGPTTS